jgi:hypothetical protein
MISSKTISPAGANWVRKSLDPFHDFEVRVDGMPDDNTSRVVIQEVTLSKTISVPAGIAGNWDCHIATLPELANASAAVAGQIDGNGVIQNAASQPASGFFPTGLISIVSTAAGGVTFPNGTAFAATAVADSFDFSAYFDGQKRLIALAFEVHDTTAELYRQGTLTVYRLPQVTDLTILNPYGGVGITVASASVGMISRLPPSILSEALLLPGARQWEVRDGAYLVSVMDPTRNDLKGSQWALRAFTKGDVTQAGEYCVFTPPSTSFGTVATSSPGGTARWAPVVSRCKPLPFHTAGCYLTGLNNASTLTITARAIFESAPTPDNTQLVVLAQPSPDYDPVAIELYKAAAAKIPVGVPVGENASGDFWDGVLGIISDVAPILGAIAPIPGASVLGKVIGGAAKAGQNARNSASERKQVEGNFKASGAKNAVSAGSNAAKVKKK